MVHSIIFTVYRLSCIMVAAVVCRSLFSEVICPGHQYWNIPMQHADMPQMRLLDNNQCLVEYCWIANRLDSLFAKCMMLYDNLQRSR